jgi:phosphopantothenoylcysteine synthetase/decarboxylase
MITTGAEPTVDLPRFVATELVQNWDVCVIATPEAARFFDTAQVAEMTGHPVRTQFKDPDQPDVLPPADVLLLAPATFNTINKLAAGISDTLALALLNEGVGQRLPVVAAPWVNEALGRHPAFVANIARLRDWGIAVIESTALGTTGSSTGFPWDKVSAELARHYDKLTSGRPA